MNKKFWKCQVRRDTYSKRYYAEALWYGGSRLFLGYFSDKQATTTKSRAVAAAIERMGQEATHMTSDDLHRALLPF